MRIAVEPDQTVNVIQITDPHLGDQPSERLLGLDTDFSLAQVVACVAKERSSADLLLATGDVASGGAANAYQRFLSATASLAQQTLWLPGNHDTLATMASASLQGEMEKCVDVGNWRIVMLNSKTPNAVGGSFSAQELQFLEASLQASAGRHVLLCLHHHPIPIGCAWLDRQRVANSDDFFALVDQFPQVKGIMWGHIHQQIDTYRERANATPVRLMATPSSCIQFAANSDDFQLARLNPGYRWLQLAPDGEIHSAVSRVEGVDFSVDYDDSSGY